MPKEILLEVAVTSLERAIAAERAGAHRLELCEQLEVGGVMPSVKLVRYVRSAVQIPIHVLVRPRAGNFIYTADEFAQMKSEIAALHRENVQGIVTGILRSDRSIDVKRTRELVALAAPLPVTFHRAFDETSDLAKALEDVVRSGADRILTSGGAPDAPHGAPVLRRLVEEAGERLTILPGGGLHARNIASIARIPNVRELHTGLGTVLSYGSVDEGAFEREVNNCIARLNFFSHWSVS